MLLGGGGHALVVAEAAALSGRRVAGFLDDSPAASLGELCVRLGALSLLEEDPDGALPAGAVFVVCVGEERLRRAMSAQVGDRAAPPVIHPRAIVSPRASVAGGVFVGPGAIVHARARVERHAIINSGAIVEHDCAVGENAHIAPGSALGGGVVVGAGALVGLGARALPGVRIGAGCVVGAGAVVLADTPTGATVAGVPARVVRSRPTGAGR